ncbi:MAG: ABC transporter permease subunit [Eubacteriales bacterium]|nr:ABC transporter permease subunit [Eubacteriales bacterium]
MLALMRKHYQIYLLLLPTLIYFLIFKYGPMYGLQMAFRNYNTGLGIWNSPWVGLKYFKRILSRPYFYQILSNTLTISLTSLIAGFPLPILFSLMLNEMRGGTWKKSIQTITYAPHFISTVVLAAMITIFLSPSSGIVNKAIEALGGKAVNFMMRPECFVPIYVISGIWQGLGWNAIIYVAALASVDPALHESAMIDGASRLQRILHINLPCILPTVIIMLILQTGSLLNVGFEKVFLLSNDAVLETSEVISTYTYRIGIAGAQFSQSAAIGLFNSVVQFIMLVIVNTLARRLSETSLW